MRSLRSLRLVLHVPRAAVLCLGALLATAVPHARGDRPAELSRYAAPDSPPEATPSVCTPSADALETLRRDTQRLTRQGTPRPWTRAEGVLISIDALCGAARSTWATCAAELRAPARAAAGACSGATQHVWEAIQQEQELREGRRELRRLSSEERERDYAYLVGQYEQRQQSALQQLPQSLDVFAQHLATFDSTRTASDATSQTAVEPALLALRAAHAQLSRLNTDIQRAVAPAAAHR